MVQGSWAVPSQLLPGEVRPPREVALHQPHPSRAKGTDGLREVTGLAKVAGLSLKSDAFSELCSWGRGFGNVLLAHWRFLFPWSSANQRAA